MRTKEERKKKTEERKEQRIAKTNEQQIQALDKRLGKGVGAEKERARLKGE